MSLSTFIETNMEDILTEWESFARSLGAITSDMSIEALRDHARQMLLVIVADMQVVQSPDEQEAKGKGHGPAGEESAASAHGTGRHRDGFSLLQLTAEFRALRASVLRKWLPTIEPTDGASVDDMIRFNEAVDQAIAESVAMFSDAAGEARDVFLAMLGHDLRSPLHAIALTAEYFEREEVERDRRLSSAKRIKRSAASMTRMVNDLLEFSRLHLGGGIPISRGREDLVRICQRAVEDARTAHPACTFNLTTPDELPGEYDADRLGQVFGNLLNNAYQYRARGSEVDTSVTLDEGRATVSVHNFGTAIPPTQLTAIFDPLVQLKIGEGEVERPRSSAGLGLFIARRIVEAHGGQVTVTSDRTAGTTFSVGLP